MMNEQIKAYFAEKEYIIVVQEDFHPDFPLVADITLDQNYWVIPGQKVGYLEFKETMRKFHLELNTEEMFIIDRRFTSNGFGRNSRSFLHPKDFYLTSKELLIKTLDEQFVSTFNEEPHNAQKISTTVEGEQLWFVSRVKIDTEDFAGKLAHAFYIYDPTHELSKVPGVIQPA